MVGSHTYSTEEKRWLAARKHIGREELRRLFEIKFKHVVDCYTFNKVCTSIRGAKALSQDPQVGDEFKHNGYTMVFVAEGGRTRFKNRTTKLGYKPKHIALWEAAHGPIPAAHALACRSNDKRNADPSNWALMRRGDIIRLYRHGRSAKEADPETRDVLIQMAKLEGMITRLGGKTAHRMDYEKRQRASERSRYRKRKEQALSA